MKKTIFTKTSTIPGNVVAVMGGVHGNEKIGIKIIEELIHSFEPRCGTVHFIFGNPKALEENVRFTETNLNRSFIRTDKPISYEEKRAQEIMDVLDDCDALLDIHAYNEPDMQKPVFAICEEKSFSVVDELPIDTVLSGFNDIQKGGSHGYMDNQSKVGIVLELGSISNSEKYLNLGLESSRNFLAHYGLVEGVNISESSQAHFKTSGAYIKKSNEFKFTKEYKSFDLIKAGEMIAVENANNLQAKTNSIILFPRPNAQVGAEAYWLMESIK